MINQKHVEATQNLDIAKKLNERLGEDFVKELHAKIDSTSSKVGGHVHRSDFTHDPRIQATDFLSNDVDVKEIVDKLRLDEVRDVSKITQLHQIQDAATSSEGQIVNGHIMSEQMVADSKEAVEQMKQGQMPDLEKFKWTEKHGDNIPDSVPEYTKIPEGARWQTFSKACSPNNLHSVGSQAAKAGAVTSGIISTVKNGYKWIDGQQDGIDTIDNITQDVSCGVCSSYVGGVTGYAAAVGMTLLISNPAGWVVLGVSVAAGIGGGYVTSKAHTAIWDSIPVLKIKWWKKLLS